jgi:signal transduction histidine kinase
VQEWTRLLASTERLKPEADEDPLTERRVLVSKLRDALEHGERDAVTTLVREFLSHRRQYRLGFRDDLATSLAAVELLQTKTTPARQLLERLLVDGFGAGEPGLQRFVLESAPRLSSEELAALCEVVVRQSRRASVPADDFARRCAQLQRVKPPTVSDPGRVLTVMDGHDGEWVVRGGADLRGTAVSLSALTAAQETSMRERGLLLGVDRLVLSSRTGPVQALAVQVDSPRWDAAVQSRRGALALKLGLLTIALLLGIGLVAVSFAVQRQERALVEAKNELVSTVSHELRTPLASLRVMAETLERKLASGADAKDWPARIVGEVDGLTALVENILSFNRLDQGRDVLQRRPWKLDEVRAWLEADAPPDVNVTVTGTEGIVLDADPTWMKVAFLNLSRNARKYNERTPVEFCVSARTDGSSIVLDVRDNGIGIAPEQWSDVFEAFHRLRDGRGRGGGGSGLGLALVKRVIEGHGGSVAIVDSSPAGTTFRVRLVRSLAGQ